MPHIGVNIFNEWPSLSLLYNVLSIIFSLLNLRILSLWQWNRQVGMCSSEIRTLKYWEGLHGLSLLGNGCSIVPTLSKEDRTDELKAKLALNGEITYRPLLLPPLPQGPFHWPLCQHHANAMSGATVSSWGHQAPQEGQLQPPDKKWWHTTHTRMLGDTEVGTITGSCQMRWEGSPEAATQSYACALPPFLPFPSLGPFLLAPRFRARLNVTIHSFGFSTI